MNTKLREAGEKIFFYNNLKLIHPKPIPLSLPFTIHKFTDRPRLDGEDRIIFSCFSEFGCEVLGVTYQIPRAISENQGKYFIAVGWRGRSFLYRHLVDEFWELNENYQNLRDNALAFHNNSKTLKLLDRSLENYGVLCDSNGMSKMVVANQCECGNYWGYNQKSDSCSRCYSKSFVRSLFADPIWWRRRAKRLPLPSEQVLNKVKQFLPDNKKTVAVTARNRKTYGRNLGSEFYKNLISILEEMDYNVIWIGEEQTTLKCPNPKILDFTRMKESLDLEFTLGLVSKCDFTIQFWTASTRLAGAVATPYLLFESPDQLFGRGQEGLRLLLTTFGRKKLVLSHYKQIFEDNNLGFDLIRESIDQMNSGNWNEVFAPGIESNWRVEKVIPGFGNWLKPIQERIF